jgi:hypothetical protein
VDRPLDWASVAIRAIEYLVLLVILPLTAIRLWLSAAREGLKVTVKNLHRIVAKSLAPDSVITYAVGFVVFAVAPYLLIVAKTPAGSAWVEGGLVGARLALAALLSIIGWVVTIGGIGELGWGTGARAAPPGRPADNAGQPATLSQ